MTKPPKSLLAFPEPEPLNGPAVICAKTTKIHGPGLRSINLSLCFSKRLNKVKDVPPSVWRFHPQWVMLNREMAQSVLETDLTAQWAASFAPDEALIGTQLTLMGYPLTERALPVGSTWTRWEAIHTGHPDSFAEVDARLLGQLLAAPHFFARKFRAESNIRACGSHLDGRVKLPTPSLCKPVLPDITP
jgi:hypothetical protein